MATDDILTVAYTVRGKPAEAFRAFTNVTALRDWLCNLAEVEARSGGRFFFAWQDGHQAWGRFSIFEPGKRLAFTWHHDAQPDGSTVEVRLAPAKTGTRVTVKHSGLGDAAGENGAAWRSALENLDSLLADGIDLRYARRPRLGIFIDEFTAEAAARLKIPARGVLLAGTAPGSGAEAAGLQKDDVLVTFDGAPLAHFNDLAPLVSRRKAGDAVAVDYVRGGERHTTTLTLGHFPIPKVPATGKALAKVARATHSRINAELARKTRRLTEVDAGRAPKKGEWSVKQLVAHLILTERDLQSWAAQMINDREVGEDLEYRPNVCFRIDALVDRLKTLPALRRELAIAQEETARFAEQLPRDFVTERKHLYRRFAGWIVEVTPGHFDQEHAEQLAELVK